VTSRLLNIVWLLATLSAAGCGTGVGPSSGPATQARCVRVDEDRVQALAWSPDAKALFALHGRTVAEAWTLSRIDPVTATVVKSATAEAAVGPLAVDMDGMAIWLSAPVHEAPKLVSWNGDQVEQIATMPHQLFSRLVWTDQGLAGVEYTGADDPNQPDEAARLVRIATRPGAANLDPVTEFDTSVHDVAISPDGSMIVEARRVNESQSISVTGKVMGSRPVAEGAASVDAWAEAGAVGYLGDDGIYRVWRMDGPTDWASEADRIYVSALSADGELAFTERRDDGVLGVICILGIPS
jgi:hypothetical protein